MRAGRTGLGLNFRDSVSDDAVHFPNSSPVTLIMALITSSLWLRCERESACRQVLARTGVRAELSRPLNGYSRASLATTACGCKHDANGVAAGQGRPNMAPGAW